MLTTQGVFCHAQTQRLQIGIDLQVRPRDRAVWVGESGGGEQDWTGVNSRARKTKNRMGRHGREAERDEEGGKGRDRNRARETCTHSGRRCDWAEMKETGPGVSQSRQRQQWQRERLGNTEKA